MLIPPDAARLAAKVLSTALFVQLGNDAEKDRREAELRDLLRIAARAEEMRSTLDALEGRAKTAAQKEAFGQLLGSAVKLVKSTVPKSLKKRVTMKGVGGAALGVGAVYGANRGMAAATRRMGRTLPKARPWGRYQLAPKKRTTEFGYSGS